MIRKNTKRGPIQKRIMLITLGGILFVCILISLISFYIFNNYLRDEMVSTTRSSLQNLSESIDNNVENVYRLARYCQGSSDIADYVKASPKPGSVLSVATFDRLDEEYKINEASSFIPRVCVVAGNNFLQACSTTYSTTTNIAQAAPELDFFETLLNSENYIYSTGIIPDPFMNRPNKLIVPIIRPITYQFNSNQGGFLFMEFSIDLFLSQMNHYHMEEGSILFLSMGEHLYKYEDGSLTELPSQSFDLYSIKAQGEKSSIINSSMDIQGERLNVVAVPLKMNDCYLIQSISASAVASSTRQFILLFSAILVSVIAIGVIMALSLDYYMMKPLASIRERIALTSSGDFSVDHSIEWDHELGEIGKGINDLSKSVNNLLVKRLEDEKQKRELEYKMLQSQINPHFLYNTLNSIKMMATIQGATGISEMTTALASLLRSISKGTSLLIPIEEELKLIRDYFTIQNYRYGGMIKMKINVSDESIKECSILKFTLQPLVENAIFHGLEPKGGTGNISIELFYADKKDICIEVTDDGVGIESSYIEKILSENTNAKAEFFKEIGINNVNKRLQYEFGDSYGITIESELGTYTTMRVTIPATKNVQEDPDEV